LERLPSLEERADQNNERATGKEHCKNNAFGEGEKVKELLISPWSLGARRRIN